MPNILQLKITLRDIEPKILRKFLVSDSLTFNELHEIIQKIMGWENYHLYEFKIKNIRIIPPDEGYLEENELDPEKIIVYEHLTLNNILLTVIMPFNNLYKTRGNKKCQLKSWTTRLKEDRLKMLSATKKRL